MAKNNPMNPFTRDETQTKREVSSPLGRARVEEAPSHPDGDGYHMVRIRLYGEDSVKVAPVLPPTVGGAYVPKPNTDVAVVFDARDNPWVVAPWYASDRLDRTGIKIPDYEAGEVVLGNQSGATIRIDNDGNIHLNSSDSGSVYIDGVEQ